MITFSALRRNRPIIGTTSCTDRVQEWRNRPQAFRNVSFRRTKLVCRDPPDVTGRILYSRLAISVKLINRLFQRGGAGFDGALINRVCIRHIKMKRGGHFFNRLVAADHKFGFAYPNFGMQAAG